MEKLTLVTSFASLKTGDYVELRVCGLCGRNHRGILIRRCDGDARCCWDTEPALTGWYYNPGGGHHKEAPYGWVGPNAVLKRRLYLIDTGLENTTDITAAHKIPATTKKRERA